MTVLKSRAILSHTIRLDARRAVHEGTMNAKTIDKINATATYFGSGLWVGPSGIKNNPFATLSAANRTRVRKWWRDWHKRPEDGKKSVRNGAKSPHHP